MKKRIFIQGDFLLEGDIPCLDKCVKRFEYAELELEYNPVVRLMSFKGKTTHKATIAKEDKDGV